MNFEQFQQIVQKTRCVRRFQPNITIPKKDLLDLINLARITSSGKNMQPLKYIAINDEKIKEEIYKPLKWAAHLQDWTQKESEKPSAYILVVNDTSIEGFSAIDSGVAMQTILLGATTKGYNGCILASIDKVAYKKLFNLSEKLEPLFIIALGVADENIQIVEPKNGDTNYYRDSKGTHFVPKRTLKEVLING